MALSTRQKQDIKRRQVQMGVKTRKRRPAKWLFPKTAERDYLKVLKVYVNTYIDLINQILIPQLDSISDEAKGYRPDGVRSDDWSDRISSLLQSVIISFEDKAPKPENFVPIVGSEVSEFNKAQFNKVFKSVMAVDIFIAEPWLRPQMNSFTKENVTLIKSIPSQSLTKVEGMVQRGIASGRLTREIEKDIKKEFGVVKRRAELIARDQIGKLNGQLTQYRQKEAGIKTYTWRTAGDERVRSSHEELSGQVFSWDNPPSQGNPGEAINCRCYAEPNLSGLLDL